ncbi:MAG: ATP-binding protein [Deltaproteobacteria bacterium]|nr:ATP-binding protein [Deltaproteobacteria bacterium]
MFRSLQQSLLHWKDDTRRKPLILRGARQVGKTYAVTQFGQEHFPNHFVAVDFEKRPDLHVIFQRNLEPQRIRSELEIAARMPIIPGKTLLFLDEIQACPRALMALRYFYEELPELHLIAAGSLLEFALRDIAFPVGRVMFTSLYPLTFAEFLRALAETDLAELVLTMPTTASDRLSDFVHEQLLQKLRLYFFVGGMPEAVATYLQTGSLRDAMRVHADLVYSYRQDFATYAPRANKLALDQVFRGVATQGGRQIKYTNLSRDFTIPTIKKNMELLVWARILSIVQSARPEGLPLGATATMKRFKTILVDLGLMNHLCGMPMDTPGVSGSLLSLYKGALAEQFVGQELLAAQDGELYYWSRAEKSSQAEVDFLIVREGDIFPVEVKSGPAGRLRSLHLFFTTYPQCLKGFVLSEAPFSVLREQKMVFLPLYYAYAVGSRGVLSATVASPSVKDVGE